MPRKINKNLKYLTQCLSDQEYKDDKITKGKRGVVLEGSSRSGKTISAVDFIILLCVRYETSCTINIVKETYNEFKTTLYDDFKKRLNDFGLDNPFDRTKEIQSFKIFGNRINFLGADKLSKFHGVSCDYLYINEALPIGKEIFDQLEMRCRKFWFMDYNPSVTQHWIFDNVIPRNDVGWLHSTFKDNPFISSQEKQKILSYEPWEPGSYEVVWNDTGSADLYHNYLPIDKNNQPPPHPYNIENGTADEYMWKVYGLGLRGAQEGLIFQNVLYTTERPDFAYTYGLDFGYVTDETCLVRHWEDSQNIWGELLCYQPMDTPEEIDAFLTSQGIEKTIPITADSADRYISERRGVVKMVQSLQEMGWKIDKVRKTKNVMFWISSMKKKRIHIIKNDLYRHAKKEQENYRFKTVNGIQINQPEDKWNHYFDSLRYSHMAHNDNQELSTDWN